MNYTVTPIKGHPRELSLEDNWSDTKRSETKFWVSDKPPRGRTAMQIMNSFLGLQLFHPLAVSNVAREASNRGHKEGGGGGF